MIPPKVNRKTIISFDRDMYRWRHLIENTFAKLKEFRAVATRYDKTDTSYTATIHLAAANSTLHAERQQALVRMVREALKRSPEQAEQLTPLRLDNAHLELSFRPSEPFRPR